MRKWKQYDQFRSIFFNGNMFIFTWIAVKIQKTIAIAIYFYFRALMKTDPFYRFYHVAVEIIFFIMHVNLELVCRFKGEQNVNM